MTANIDSGIMTAVLFISVVVVEVGLVGAVAA